MRDSYIFIAGLNGKEHAILPVTTPHYPTTSHNHHYRNNSVEYGIWHSDLPRLLSRSSHDGLTTRIDNLLISIENSDNSNYDPL